MDYNQVIDSMVTDIMNNSNSEARDTFANIMNNKITDALEAKKQELQQNLYRSPDSAKETADANA